MKKSYLFHCDALRCKAQGKLCCQRYHAIITEEEAQQIIELLPQIRELLGIDLDALQQYQSPFKSIEADTLEIIHSDKYKACVFLLYNEQGVPRCSIAEICSRRNLDYRRYKPFGCRIFPLDIKEETETRITLVLHPDASTFPCLTASYEKSTQSLEELAMKELEI